VTAGLPDPAPDRRDGGQIVTGSVVLGDVVQIQNVGGNATVTLSRPVYRVEGLRAVRVRPSAQMARAQPSRLLLARHEVVPFQGRETLLADLSGWLTEPDVPMSVRLVHGPGGQGKTRLAAHLARSYATGWKVWQVRQSLPTAAGLSRLEISPGENGLVVVDYADRWALSHLQALLADLHTLLGRLPGAPSLRVLLLARSAAWWWDAVEDWLDSELQVPAAAVALRPLGEQVDRRRMFTVARDHFAAVLEVTGCETVEPPNELDDPAFSQVLTVHMAALCAVDAYLHRSSAPTRPDRISEYLLKRERGHWLRWHTRAEDPLPTPPQTLGRAVYVATLTGPLSHTQGVRALRRVQVTAAPDQVLTDHRQFYPADDPATVLEPLFPDRLGEDFLALTTPGGDGDTEAADPWAYDAAIRLVAPAGEDEPPPAWTGTAITVLAETARRWPHVATRLLYPLLRAHPQIALQADGTALTTLAALPDVEPALLRGVTTHLPDRRQVDLDVGMAALAQRVADDYQDTGGDPAERARVHTMLSLRLSNAGLHHQALDAAQITVDLYRRLAAADPAAHDRDLAISLHDLGIDLGRVGRREEALTAAAEAVMVYRRLAAADPAAVEPGLAGALDSLGGRMSTLGRLEEALALHQEAVEVYRRAAGHDPAAVEPDLVVALNNLGLGLAAFGRWEEALAAIQEAVGIFRRLVDADAAAYEPDLAMSLNALDTCLANLGRQDEALAAGREAVDIHRRLATVNPAAFEPDLAISLGNLGLGLSESGEGEQALASAREAVEIHRRLATVNPAAYEPDLAASLNSLGGRLSELGRADEALPPVREAVEIYRRLVTANPDACEPGLAMSLRNLGASLSENGHPAEALETIEEAVRLYRRLAAANPAYESELAGSLSALAQVAEAARTDLV
jgi:tetratricopeptide (TPR) repeat protein